MEYGAELPISRDYDASGRPAGPDRAEPIRLRTLVMLRWAAIGGQMAAVIVAWSIGLRFAIWPALALIGASALLNIWLLVGPALRVSYDRAAAQLGFDMLQIALLLWLTGGPANPFALLVLAPVTIAATALPKRQTAAIGAATILLVSFAFWFALPLRMADGRLLDIRPLLALGHWVAIIIGVVFFAAYSHRVTAELSATSSALFSTQMALAREQRLQHLGGVVAATAHELGTPLATIKLIAGELADELADRPDLGGDLAELRRSADRCGQILRAMGQAGKDDLLLHSAPLHVVLEEAAGLHASRGPQVLITAEGPDIRRDPGVIHALRNLIQNAVDFARQRVLIEAMTDRNTLTITISDDGPGYPPALLARLGDPYPTPRRNQAQRPGYEGMGLGLFIAKTLLERSGAALDFSNGGPGAVVRVSWPLDRIAANSRRPLGKNPSQSGLDMESLTKS
ncbi:ActS/PrrB/RegB family redox-sensitive histidine kinase [Paracoccus sp. M683]|uniref:ActS/PrrB/RegB family redox-sensitive histidine kinase n=1 Tax=Paracoccus sp. M683 TaxID=2594268 RepID=UPI001180B674|nr:ActS/PrrB/RegB family redox-sensitive histidine kinase [Paracoccus sp. M683]TRW98810.1 ActS/PrrB/RegB family redox-sensitive histidine kinase [Paracoccus sp. M683]